MENHLSVLKVNNILTDYYNENINLAKCLNEFGSEIFFTPKPLYDLVSSKDYSIYKIMSNFEYLLNEPDLGFWKNIWGYVKHLNILESNRIRCIDDSWLWGQNNWFFKHGSTIERLEIYIDEHMNYVGKVICPFCKKQIDYISGNTRFHTWCEHLIDIERVSDKITEIPELVAFFLEEEKHYE